MSLILDALKRAERERKLEKAPDLSAIYQEGREGDLKDKAPKLALADSAKPLSVAGKTIKDTTPSAPSAEKKRLETPKKASVSEKPLPVSQKKVKQTLRYIDLPRELRSGGFSSICRATERGIPSGRAGFDWWKSRPMGLSSTTGKGKRCLRSKESEIWATTGESEIWATTGRSD